MSSHPSSRSSRAAAPQHRSAHHSHGHSHGHGQPHHGHGHGQQHHGQAKGLSRNIALYEPRSELEDRPALSAGLGPPDFYPQRENQAEASCNRPEGAPPPQSCRRREAQPPPAFSF